MPLWDVVAVLAVFALTRPLADLQIAPTGVDFPGQQSSPGAGEFAASTLLLAAIAVVGLALVDQRTADPRSRIARFPGLAAVSAISAWLALVGTAAAHVVIDLDQLVVVSLMLPFLWLMGRVLLSPPARPDRVILVGSGRIAAHLSELCRRNPASGMEVIGCIDDAPLPWGEGAPTLLGSLDELPRLLATQHVDRVVVCFSQSGDAQIADVLRQCDAQQVELDMVPRMFDLVGPSPRSRTIGGFPLVSLSGGGPRTAQGIAKRGFDLVFASVLLLIALPAMAAIALAVKVDSPGPVLYRSRRLGRKGRPFWMLKFRTMLQDADATEREAVAGLITGELKRDDDPRVTRVGRLLRRTSLDELPQMLNVIAGTMSVVGPRPVLATESSAVEGWAGRRYNVRPGVTGLWQVLGRSTIPWDERMQLDYGYARHWSLAFDLKILASTVSAIFSRRGAC